MYMTEPKPEFGRISEDFLEEGGWDLMVGITHDSETCSLLRPLRALTVSKEELGAVAGVRSSLCALPKSFHLL